MSENDSPNYITLSQAAKLAPSHPSACAVWRWCRVGIKTRVGNRIKLDHVRVGGRIYTTETALQSFFRDTAAADAEHFQPRPAAPKQPTNGQRERQREQANTTLREAGIL